MKNKLLKRLILPISVICLSCFISVGTTYALFTSKSETNIAVTSGKVNLTAAAKDVTLYSPTLVDTDGTVLDDTNAATTIFANGGTAVLTDGNLALNNVSPGDKATFKIFITNNSNISIKYRVVFSDETSYTGSETYKLVDMLKFTCNSAAVEPGNVIKDWTSVKVTDAIPELTISVELPTTVNDHYQTLSANLKFAVEAVQENAKTSSDTIVELEADNYGTGEYDKYFYRTEQNYEFKSGTTYKVTAITDEDIPIMFASIAKKSDDPDPLEWDCDDLSSLATLISFECNNVKINTIYDDEDYMWIALDDEFKLLGCEGTVTATFKMSQDYTGTFFFSLGL